MVTFGSILSNASSATNAGGLVLIENKIITSDSQVQTFSGLDGDSDVAYLLKGTIKSNAGAAADLTLEPNNISTNQTAVLIQGDGTSVTTVTETTLEFGAVLGNGEMCFDLFIFSSKSINSIARQRIGMSKCSIEGPRVRMYGFHWNETTTNITSLEVQASSANAIGNGSQLILYKWATA